MGKDYYQILGVSKTASSEEIKSAFRKKAHEHHPDKGGDAEKFKEINEAYQVLGNQDKRRQYDQFGSSFQNGQAGGFSGFSNGGFNGAGMNFDFGDLGDMFGGFGDIFGFGSASGQRQPRRGRDLEMNLELDFEEAAFGCEKELKILKKIICSNCHGEGAATGSKIETCSVCGGSGRVSQVQRTIFGNIQAQTTCHNCHGEGKVFEKKCSHCHGEGVVQERVSLKVRIPAGIDEGESIRLSGQGEAAGKGLPAGDLYLRISLKKSKDFVREAYDIKTERHISVKQAILGDSLEIKSLRGPLKLKIPAGTQSGTIFKLKGQGIEKLNNRGIGDQYVKVIVDIPSDLPKKTRQILEELDF